MPTNFIGFRPTTTDREKLDQIKTEYNLTGDSAALRKALELATVKHETALVKHPDNTATEAFRELPDSEIPVSAVRTGDIYRDMLGHVWMRQDNGYGVPTWQVVRYHS